MLSICVYFSNIVHFYIAVLFINVILGLDPRIQVIGLVRHRRIQICHSCAGRNRDYAVRANASQQQIFAILFYHAVFAEYYTTVSWSNFKDPIPACAGMTREKYCFLF